MKSWAGQDIESEGLGMIIKLHFLISREFMGF
jgi:hypothetical protein